MPGIPSPTLPTAIPPAIPAIPSHWTFPAEPLSVRRARQAVAEALPGACRPQLRDDLRLLASELVTNSVRYGPQPTEDHLIEVVLWRGDGHYWLAVSDAGSTLPIITRSAGPGARGGRGGRGLLLVDALAAAWAVIPRPARGKTVVAGVRLHDRD
ncbi:ATP-binding protein [Streptomyces aidingensis]|uniref:Anti-sigma regulatory factor (Ser/Thr protein kinase) n=1 Tax=Streptomyces aidingensis TaxID=910347 RepID=A0A1I1V1G7_9ACTN|nr:ATP-binding protein [Streptomyces aidingensis]SFD76922.1 Anti-sigma regulatory factor (Ser/Thr protein kinase) [Streptomyces aidingensis]